MPRLGGAFFLPHNQRLAMMAGTEKHRRGIATLLASSTSLYVLLYAGIMFIVYAGALAGNVDLPEGRESLILETLGASSTLAWQFIVFGLTVLALNLAPVAFLISSMRVASPVLVQIGISRIVYFSVVVLLGWTAVLSLNKLFFPRSAFGYLLPIDSTTSLVWTGGAALSGYLVLGVFPALWRLAGLLRVALKQRATQVALGGVIAVGVGVVPPLHYNPEPASVTGRRPDVIVIGVDSLSPLHMRRHPGALPRLEGLLQDSTVFTQTLTPLARTFPAWTSILTAKYPVNSGARFNLTSFEQVDIRATLPGLLKMQGYKTIYAQDERKFNNIDEQFGFDLTVGPKPGAAEFVMAKVADQPLVNLALLSPWAKQLFPFIANNRAAPIHYDPLEFVNAIVQQLPTDSAQPLFLAAHFCLAHHPYTWRTQVRMSAAGKPLSYEDKHIAALTALDEQINRLLKALDESGRLENAIVIVLSDHGESMAYSDGLWPDAREADGAREGFRAGRLEAFSPQSGYTGHGSNVLDRTQYQSLLAFRGFGEMKDAFPARDSQRLASLVDVMPTLLATLGLRAPTDIDGVDVMTNDTDAKRRVVPTETGIRFLALGSVVHVDEDALLAESKEYYRVEPSSARLIVKPERYPDLVNTKDVALHTDEWMLALLRKDQNPSFRRVALLVHKPSGAWTIGGDGALIARAPIEVFRQTAAELYGGELDDFSGTWAFR